MTREERGLGNDGGAEKENWIQYPGYETGTRKAGSYLRKSVLV